MGFLKSIDNDVTHQKIFTIIIILAIFMFLHMANLLLIFSKCVICYLHYLKRIMNDNLYREYINSSGFY